MAQPRMPYQCMAKLGNILVAARGSSIDSFSLPEGSFLSSWTSSTQREANGKAASSEVKPTTTLQNSESSSVDITLDDAPPAKKRRLSMVTDEEDKEDEKELVKEGMKKKTNRSDAVVSGLEAPTIIALAVAKNGKHVVAVTGEDKSIRVFENVSEDGKQVLKQLSQRTMPKRPCAITISKDDTTIISADKFGDVYSLPLIPSKDLSANVATPEPSAAPKPFVPAANEFTIHSERNRKALENQRRQTRRPAEKTEPKFEHKLLLGHVSMLTDVILAEYQGRDYILTADRDEHIRVSRGIPQTHVIEGFCLGHREFVSRLCIPSRHPELLISGGGDDKLFVWEWLSGRLISTVDIASHLEQALGDLQDVPAIKPAISSIDAFQISKHEDLVLVSSSGVPAIFIFRLSSSQTARLTHYQTLTFPGNVLSVVSYTRAEGTGIMSFVATDILHKPGSTSKRRNEPISVADFCIEKLMYIPEEGTFSRGVFVQTPEIEDIENEVPAMDKVGNLLYNLENLRKREGDMEGGEE